MTNRELRGRKTVQKFRIPISVNGTIPHGLLIGNARIEIKMIDRLNQAKYEKLNTNAKTKVQEMRTKENQMRVCMCDKLCTSIAYSDAGLGGNSPVVQFTAAEPSSNSSVPPLAKMSSQVSQFFFHALPLTFKL